MNLQNHKERKIIDIYSTTHINSELHQNIVNSPPPSPNSFLLFFIFHIHLYKKLLVHNKTITSRSKRVVSSAQIQQQILQMSTSVHKESKHIHCTHHDKTLIYFSFVFLIPNHLNQLSCSLILHRHCCLNNNIHRCYLLLESENIMVATLYIKENQLKEPFSKQILQCKYTKSRKIFRPGNVSQ